MAPHSSTLAWKIPWMEEPGRLQCMGSLRVGHDWATSLSRIGEGNGNPLQCSCVGNPQGWGSLVRCCLWGRTKSDTTEATDSAAADLGDAEPVLFGSHVLFGWVLYKLKRGVVCPCSFLVPKHTLASRDKELQGPIWKRKKWKKADSSPKWLVRHCDISLTKKHWKMSFAWTLFLLYERHYLVPISLWPLVPLFRNSLHCSLSILCGNIWSEWWGVNYLWNYADFVVCLLLMETCKSKAGCCFVPFSKIYLFLVALGLRCYSQAFSSCSKQRLLFIKVRRLLLLQSRISRVRAQQLWCPGLAALQQCEVFPNQGWNPCPLHWRWILIPCTTRGVLFCALTRLCPSLLFSLEI